MAIALATPHGSHIQPVGIFPNLGKAPLAKVSMWTRLGLGRWLHHRDERSRSPLKEDDQTPQTSQLQKPALARRLTRRVGVGLSRHPTFRRQNSEHRDRLTPVNSDDRRAFSVDRRRPLSLQRTRSPPSTSIARLSAPEISWQDQVALASIGAPPTEVTVNDHASTVEPEPVASVQSVPESYLRKYDTVDSLEWELEHKWILNLSMHFRDKSEREKFFVTYAETPSHWRRVTISCDYRGAPPDSLEQDLKDLHYQRDKSARIYESIHDSLPEIQFYDTVTNLKLETSDGRLHVHVTEDINEIIPYPPVSSVRHLGARLISERDLRFDGHLSGFVYRVLLDGKTYIKKEIPGPDTVDEFLYEINALHALSGSRSVIGFEGIVVDDHGSVVKGLLISYAEQGALIDVLYDYHGQLTLARRERWAKQIVQGLCEIHEAGYVQGDFTLSNVVIDSADNAKIIDINRRGCPVGWEPPEIGAKIESNQRISMYIGVKSDLFQLGMTLWAIAMQEDEPERQIRPLTIPSDVKVPEYYRKIVAICLSARPQDRLSAKELLGLFPNYLPDAPNPAAPDHSTYFADSPRLIPVPRYSRSETSLCLDRTASLNVDNDTTPNVVYVSPTECFDSLSGHSDYMDYPPRGRQPGTYSLRLSDSDTPSLSPHPSLTQLSEPTGEEIVGIPREPAPDTPDINCQQFAAIDDVPNASTTPLPPQESPSLDHPPLYTEPPEPDHLLGPSNSGTSESFNYRPVEPLPPPSIEQASLFASQLPINPALESNIWALNEETPLTLESPSFTLKQSPSNTPTLDPVPLPHSETPIPLLDAQPPLSEYELPVNLAPQPQEQPNDEKVLQIPPEAPAVDQTMRLDNFSPAPTALNLSESILPINPAFEASGNKPEVQIDISPAPTVLILSESILPINPAFEASGNKPEVQIDSVSSAEEYDPPTEANIHEDETRIFSTNLESGYQPFLDPNIDSPQQTFEEETSGCISGVYMTPPSEQNSETANGHISPSTLLWKSILPINPAFSSLYLDEPPLTAGYP